MLNVNASKEKELRSNNVGDQFQHREPSEQTIRKQLLNIPSFVLWKVVRPSFFLDFFDVILEFCPLKTERGN